MKDVKKKIYDKAYGCNEFSYKPPSGVLGFFYKKLMRFEVNRYHVSYNLLPSDKEKLLDVGCGDGDFIFMAKDKFKECFGVDVSPLRIKRARKRLKERPDKCDLHFSECDVDEGLPFSDSFFDVVSCIAVLEHVLNPPNIVEEIHRVLKLGGIFIVQVPNFAWIPCRIQLLFGKLPVTGGVYLGADWEHLHNFTKTTLCQLLVKKGFKIKDISCSGIFAKCRKCWLSTLGGDLVVKGIKT